MSIKYLLETCGAWERITDLLHCESAERTLQRYADLLYGIHCKGRAFQAEVAVAVWKPALTLPASG